MRWKKRQWHAIGKPRTKIETETVQTHQAATIKTTSSLLMLFRRGGLCILLQLFLLSFFLLPRCVYGFLVCHPFHSGFFFSSLCHNAYTSVISLFAFRISNTFCCFTPQHRFFSKLCLILRESFNMFHCSYFDRMESLGGEGVHFMQTKSEFDTITMKSQATPKSESVIVTIDWIKYEGDVWWWTLDTGQKRGRQHQ